ncbi:alpha/beta hydrolase [Pedobacter sp. SD-b]|uniref:Alpha/beta hydrolase n=1 Tax=Pedobacter segetis TaxID=2793069 RepID=A0ABS1BJS9_9SPHI|nr:alpha/beta hydrolase [Pedobacter segetis]MBK0382601.1 alpha/beta hydrolase [Pedobacter segetis]
MQELDHTNGNYIENKTAKIYFEETGNPQNTPLLLTHGAFGNLEDFNLIVSKLIKDFRVIAIDSRGHGKSTLGDKELSYELLQSDVEAVLNHLQLAEIDMIGISDGGIIGYRLACYSNIKINKLITISSRWDYGNVLATKELLKNEDADYRRKNNPEPYHQYQKLNPEPNFDLLTEQLHKMWFKKESYPAGDVKNIKSETLIIKGDKDKVIQRSFVFDVAEFIPNSNLMVVPFAKHLVYKEEPEILMKAINEFLA